MDLTPDNWSPQSWRQVEAVQQPPYEDMEALEAATADLAQLPPLVTSWEIERLKGALAQAAEGKAFVLQGGDCAERLTDCRSDRITNKLKILLQMSLVLVQGIKKPVIRIGRIAGQYAKPRSSSTETIDGKTLPSYFGDLVNDFEFNETARRPDPRRLITAYHYAAMTLNFIRSLADGGFADLHHPEQWDLAFMSNKAKASLPPELHKEYERLCDSLANAVEVMEVIAPQSRFDLKTVEFFISHEALNLRYEEAMTRQVPRRPGYYNLNAHLPWIGERTRQVGQAHVEFHRGIRNPVGVKVGPTATPEEITELIEVIDPTKEPGRLVLIGRFGHGNVAERLPALIEAVRETGRKAVWLCDPMHGNTVKTSTGHKTRPFDAILEELINSIDVHAREGSHLGGVHFELTGENVAECIGGASNVTEADLDLGFESRCDPRLNYEQAMELAFAVARKLGK